MTGIKNGKQKPDLGIVCFDAEWMNMRKGIIGYAVAVFHGTIYRFRDGSV